MGDRTNPIKFGPEWLRNLSREPSTGGMASGGGACPGGQATGGGGSANPNRPTTSSVTSNANSSNTPNTSKVLLAKLRYGREEMLALYDRQSAEAPAQLKAIETLYQPRGKPPYALINTFEEDTRDNVRGPPPISGMSTGDRYSQGRGRGLNIMNTDSRGRALSAGDSRGRSRGFVRQSSLGRAVGWHGNPRNSYSGMPDDDPNQLRPWNNNSGMNSAALRPSVELADWANKTAYRNKTRPNTNWRQQNNREEGEEWRSPDGGRRPQEKWERDWGERNQEKPWNNNRRTWVGGDASEDTLPEWAVDNAEACGGTFDSSGAFHGYSNDDTNLPKSQESSYQLTRSLTHGSFARSKTMEEGSEEWWASEKAKKLSPKRFDASEIKFKKPSGAEEKSNTSSASPTSTSNTVSGGAKAKNAAKATASAERPKSEPPKTQAPYKNERHSDSPENQQPTTVSDHPENPNKKEDNAIDKSQYQHTNKKTYGAMIRGDYDNQNDEGNFKSVILTTNNNSLRQKHQNIGTPNETPKRQQDHAKMMQYFDNSNQARQSLESEEESRKEKANNRLVEEILDMSLEGDIPSATMNHLLSSGSAMSAGMASAVNSLAQLPNPALQLRMTNSLQGLSLSGQNKQMSPSPGIQNPGPMMPPIGITNSMLNASLGLPIGPSSNMGLPMQGIPPSLPSSGLSNQGMHPSGLQSLARGNMPGSGLQSGQSPGGLQGLQGIPMPNHQSSGIQPSGMQGNMPSGMSNSGMPSGGQSGLPGFQPGGSGLQGISNTNISNSSLFLGQSSGNSTMQNQNDLPNHGGQQNMFPLHGIQRSSSQTFNNSLYGNIMHQPPPPPPIPNMGGLQNLQDQWFYEDPNKTIQGPFTSKEMFNWFRAGFFSPTLMVRRACEAVMRPLGSYGPVPFGQMDLPFPMSGGFDLRRQQSHDNIMNNQPGLGIDVESLWGQPSNAPEVMWMQQTINSRSENRINNLPMYFWDQQPSSAISSNALLPEDIAKEMKTEEQILAQLRATQAQNPVPTTQALTFMADQPTAVSTDEYDVMGKTTPHLDELQRLIQKDNASLPIPTPDTKEAEPQKPDKAPKAEQTTPEAHTPKQPQPKTTESKSAKQSKESEKSAKSKESGTKTKAKKTKDEKKEDSSEAKVKEDEAKAEKRSAESSPSKNKKEEKPAKKDLEKEKKEWLKDGFTIVKGAEKKDKEIKKKAEEAKAAEEAERKRKEEERLAAEEERKKKQIETIRKQQEVQQQQLQQRQAELVTKKAPWSAVSNQVQQTMNRDSITLAEIQRLEREKKLEQIKEQQQMMNLIAQQQAAALAREQEVQANLGWTKKKPTHPNPGQSLAEIQAEARKQAAAAAAAAAASAAAAARDEALSTPPPVSYVPWGATHNGGPAAKIRTPTVVPTSGGFWDTQPTPPSKPEKPVEAPRPVEQKAKKKVTVVAPLKKENSPAVEFDLWCNNMLAVWRDSNIDIPTFVSFLKDIESPYEVKDYVKCYLGDAKEASDFARQFLERRSRLLRVGMVTPSDDLCSPAMAVNPRTNSGSDYTEVKGKGKKIKKNKMLKVDARSILGFSVTASEDRINVGDIDTV